MKTAVYMRVSTDEQDISLQEREISLFLQSKGIMEFKIYSDVGFSGKNDQRPEFKKLLNDCKTGQIEFLVVWKLDRLFRSLRHLLSFLDDLGAYKIKFAAVRDSVDLSTPAGELMAHMIGAFAQFERSLISQRTKAGMETKRLQGVHLGRKPSLTPDLKARIIAHRIEHKSTTPELCRTFGLSEGKIVHLLKKAKLRDIDQVLDGDKKITGQVK